MSLKGKVVLVTGAARGIGRGIALRLAREGAALALVDRKAEGLEAVSREISALGARVTTRVADVGRQAEVHAAVEHAEQTLGGFDVMINNAGIVQVKPLAEVTPEDLEQITDVNIGGVVWGIQAAAARFKARGGKGKIINAASIAGHEGAPLLSLYSATKFAVRALTQAAAKEFAGTGITVNAYCPGIVGTDMWDQIEDRLSAIHGTAHGSAMQNRVANIALRRAQTPDDVAALVAFLAGTDSDYINGQSIISDGGLVYR